MKSHLIVLISILAIASCTTTKDIVYTAPVEEMEITILDTMQVSAPSIDVQPAYELPIYNPSYTRTLDLIHTKLNLSFDWKNQYVIGIAELSLKPIFYATDKIVLHAVNFDINGIQVNGQTTNEYQYDGNEIVITHDVLVNKTEEISVRIDYIAKPNEGPVGGSTAITSDKGLFFINPLNENPEKPQQIWTQGETENNSRWFPTIDRPNERCTQEIYLTVQNRFKTLSNGTLVSSVDNKNGTRTDYWKQEHPHAPYLFMIAVGEYAIARDIWNGKPVEYYVEKQYESDAKEIFNHTPEMIEYFSKILNYPYPWDKYSSVICRDYVSGAMENTTAVIFGEFVQKTQRELIDNDNDLIVAHELFHHWFGDLVTCESWANLTLNEGFANYSEYLWYEHKYGKMRADMHRTTELRNYILSVDSQGAHPLIYFGYNDKEDMFDAHSYNKGGLVLHMLRDYLGDDAFFAGLHKYLVDNEYTSVETDELRMAFEDTTGEDLNWFFDQWYFQSGHPQLQVEYTYDTITNEVVIYVDQIQNPEENAAIYQLHSTVAIYDAQDQLHERDIFLNERSQEIRIKVTDQAPNLVLFDSKDILLAELIENRSIKEYEYMAMYNVAYKYKWIALKNLSNSPKAQSIYLNLIDHPFYGIRSIATQNIATSREVEEILVLKASSDPHSKVRSKALSSLASYNATGHIDLAKSILKKEEAYPVIAEALTLLKKAKDLETLQYAAQYQDANSSALSSAVADVFIDSESDQYADYFLRKIKSASIYEFFPLMNKYGRYIQYLQAHQLSVAADLIAKISLDTEENNYKKFMATSTLSKMQTILKSKPENDESEQTILKIEQLIDQIKKTETNKDLLSRYRAF